MPANPSAWCSGLRCEGSLASSDRHQYGVDLRRPFWLPNPPMNWVDIVWPVMGGVSLTLGLIHLLIWLRQRNRSALLMFGLAAGSVAVLAIFELLLMRSQSPQQYATLLRWAQLPLMLMFVALVGFVLLHFRAGRSWLGLTVCILSSCSLLPGLVSGGNLRFRQITELQQIELWGGGTAAAPVGNPSPWILLAQASELMLVLFLADAIVSVWRRTQDPSERRRVALVCGGMILFVILASSWALLVTVGWMSAPLVVSIPFLAVLIVMSYELGGNVMSATKLERQLQESESNLRGSEQRFQFTADAVGLGLWTWDASSGESWFTNTGSALLGLAVDGPIGCEAFLALVHPDDREAIMRARDDAIHRTSRFECEYRLPQPDGSHRWISATGRVEHATSGAPLCMRSVILDISERRQAEERFRLVVESSPTAMLMIDDEGCIALANTQAARVFGYSCEELLAKKIEILLPSLAYAGNPHRAGFVTRILAAGVGRDSFGRGKDGGELPVEIALNPIRVADRLFVLASITDISERLRFEQELAVQRDELAHMSRSAVLGEMSGSLAHEINQPLTAVLSNAQAALRFLERDAADLDEVRECLVQIVENDKRAGEVIRRLRAMLRKEKINYQELQINDVVQDVLHLASNDLLNRSISTSIDLAPTLPAVSGDPVQLQQVLLNLVINACDAMDDVSAHRALTVRTRLAANASIEVSVSDVGRGIPEEDLERIFEPFVTSKSDGMGLGLAVCRTIIQAHHGTLLAANNPDRGATLHVLLPIVATTTDGTD
jgi:two-component system, LuxR family, sensor kinase FixL